MKLFTNPNYFNKIFECCKFNLYENNEILIERNQNVKKNFMFY